MWVAARHTLEYHFGEMCRHESETIRGLDPEALHDMRVATRRMRAALRVFADFIEPDQATRILKGVRRTGRALGAVRDLDVFWGKAQKYLQGLPAKSRNDLAPLKQDWEERRTQARDRMLAYLSGERYRRFKIRYHQFLGSPQAWKSQTHNTSGEPIPYRVRHVAPAAVFSRLGEVLAYQEWVQDQDPRILHQLRISIKRLRYTLEFFEVALQPPVGPVIEQLKSFQDHLGDLQDAVVAIQMLEVYLEALGGADLQSPSAPAETAGVRSYLNAKVTERDRLLSSFPEAWAAFCDPQFSEAIAQTLRMPP